MGLAQRFRRTHARDSKIFRAQQRPDEIGEKQGGDTAAQNEIEHGSDLSAKGDETHQPGENHRGVHKRNHIAHRKGPPVAVWERKETRR
jgi:hypothetical protein